MLYSQDVSRSLAGTIGATGLAEADFQTYLSASAAALETLRAQHKDGSLPLLRLPERNDDLEACRQALTNFLTDNEVDLAVVGRIGTTGTAIKQFLIGSTAERLIHRSHCSVITVPGNKH